MFINLTKEKIMDIASNEQMFCLAEKYSTQNIDININNEYNEITKYTKILAEINEEDKLLKIEILVDENGNIRNQFCSCQTKSIWKKTCKHFICVLLKLHETNEDEIIITKNNEITQKFISSFENNIYKFQPTENYKRYIEGMNQIYPTFNLEDKNISLTFKIGKRKTYAIKDIDDFVYNVNNKSTYKYHANADFDHDILMFTQNSQKIINFILKENENLTNMKEIFGITKFDEPNKVFLFKSNLDEFYNLFVGEQLPFKSIGKESGFILISEDEPDIKFDVEVTEKYVRVTYPNIHCNFFEGNEFSYLKIKDELYRVNTSYKNNFLYIIDFFNKEGINTILFKDEEMLFFKNSLLPKLQNLNLIDDLAIPNDFLERDFNIKLYFDLNINNVILKVSFCVGEAEINPLVDDLTNLNYSHTLKELTYIIKILGFKPKDEKYFILKNIDKIYFLYEKGVELLEEIQYTELYFSKQFQDLSIKSLYNYKVGTKIKGEFMEVYFETENYSTEEILEIINKIDIKKKYYRLKSGKFIKVDKNISEIYNIFNNISLMDKNLIDNKIILPKNRALYIENSFDIDYRDAIYSKLVDDFKNYQFSNIEIPCELKEILRYYQVTGYKWLKMVSKYGFGGILADDMGLGKTLQIIALLFSELNTSALPSIVVCPSSLVYNWKEEIGKFAPTLKVKLINGTAQNRNTLLNEDDEVNVYITTYDMLKRDIKIYGEMKFRFIIADEAQYIKNPQTKNSINLKKLHGEVKFALTGTPIENYLTELWSIFDFIMPGYLGSLNKFIHMYEIPIVKNSNDVAAQSLRNQIAPLILRRVKKDVLKELPAKIENNLYCEMTNEQSKIYFAYLNQAKIEINTSIKNKEFNKNHIKILSIITRLRQICCHPSLFINDYKGGSGKLELAINTLISYINSGHRILLFSQFTSMIDIIQEYLKKENITYFYLHGGVHSKQRMEMSSLFNSGERNLFLVSLKAGGVGLNLTGADVIIHFDQWWNNAVMNQATDRSHRFGQTKVVQVFNLITKDTIEEKMLILQNKKTDLANSIIESNTFMSKFSEEDIKTLFD